VLEGDVERGERPQPPAMHAERTPTDRGRRRPRPSPNPSPATPDPQGGRSDLGRGGPLGDIGDGGDISGDAAQI
jgi:hypothetical protein